MPDRQQRPEPLRGPLTAIEMATASVMAGVAVALVVIGWFFPHASSLVSLAVVPLGVVANRFRLRALVASTVAATAVSFLVGGTGPVTGVLGCALIGGLVGDAKRRGWGLGRVVACSLVMGPVLAGLADALLSIFASIRKLSLELVTNIWHGVARLLGTVGFLDGIIHVVDRGVSLVVRDWWASIPALIIVGVLFATIITWTLLGAVLERLEWIRPVDALAVVADPRPVAPVPAVLHDVYYRYPDVDVDALAAITLSIAPGCFIGVVGHNGSGKSTLVRILAGRAPSGGAVERPGGPGLGGPGGTAVVAQRPETQILGVRVADDVVWGLEPDDEADVAGLLDLVGLSGMDERDTSTLSGGELQRLAVASALARRPRLLLSDESTAMVDATGRSQLTNLLAGLPERTGVTVVHVTHRREEVAEADRVVILEGGRMVAAETSRPVRAALLAPVSGAEAEHRGYSPPGSPSSAVPLVVVEGISHTYAPFTPWAQVALSEVNLIVGEGEGVLVVGGNGSGKSTLAWILAGLIRPSVGRVTVAGQPVSGRVGTVALAFQHSRLQLQRPTVRADVAAAGGVEDDAADAALASVGLDPARFGSRWIEQLSGGEMRRVALAGLLARQPRLLVLDEPLAGLDDSSRADLLDLLGRLRVEQGLTLIVISHDLEGMGHVCERWVGLEAGRITVDRTLAGSWR